jgi:hypothetical protein
LPAQTSTNKLEKQAMEKTTLIEVGPRFCMNPIKIFSGSFGGQTLYENPFYVSPNTVSSLFYCSLPYPPEDLEDQTKVIVLN